MSNGDGAGTSRREFLGRAAGAAAAVAGAGVGAGAIARSAAGADQRRSTARRSSSLVLDGVNCGALGGVDGGNVARDVVLDPVGSDHIQRKHLGQPTYEDITLQVGSAMSKPFYEWIADSIDHGYDPKLRRNGSIVDTDANRRETRHRSFSQAEISSVSIPALDASSKDVGYVEVTLSPQRVTTVPPSGQPFQARKSKAWLCSNFVFEIDGVDTSRVASIDSFTWKQRTASDGSGAVVSVLDVSDLGVTFPRASLSSWQRWYASLDKGADDERHGVLTLLGAPSGRVASIGLFNLGLYRLLPDPRQPKHRMRAEMYCEQLSFQVR